MLYTTYIKESTVGLKKGLPVKHVAEEIHAKVKCPTPIVAGMILKTNVLTKVFECDEEI